MAAKILANIGVNRVAADDLTPSFARTIEITVMTLLHTGNDTVVDT